MGNYVVNNARFGTHQMVARLLTAGDVVLDVGCNEGYLASLCPKCEFYGIDHDATAVKVAADRYKEAHQADLNSLDALRELTLPRQFDKILLIDILEHLTHPEEILAELVRARLAENGTVIVSLPNVAHVSIRVGLLLGRFRYTDIGILDRTHLHLYTVESARQLLTSCGLRIKRMYGSSNRFGRLLGWFPFLIPLLGYNLIFECAAMNHPKAS